LLKPAPETAAASSRLPGTRISAFFMIVVMKGSAWRLITKTSPPKLKNAGVMVHRYTRKEHKPRGIFCAIGRCTDCVMVVNGQPNVRTCITPLEEGMEIRTQYGVTAEQPGGAAK
jgi:hypothetical protein